MTTTQNFTKDFQKTRKIDAEYWQLFKKTLKQTKESLPHYAKIRGYCFKEGNQKFNGRMLTAALKPRFITKNQERHLRQRTELYVKLLDRFVQTLKTSPVTRKYFNITSQEEKFLQQPTTTHPVPFIRFDGCLDPQKGLRVFEMNTNAPAMAGFVQDAYRLTKNIPAQQAIQKKYHPKYNLLAAQKILKTLLENYQAWGGKQTKPRILILRWENGYNHDSDYLAQEFQKLGYQTNIGYPTQLSYDGQRLDYHGTKYDLLLRWFDLDKLITAKPMYQDLLKAQADNKICLVSPPSSAIYAHKSLFAFFTDKQFSGLLTDHERKIIGQMCPWTRPLQPMKTEFIAGRQENLYDIALKYKNRLVIKKSISTHGKDVYIGQLTKLSDWKKVINKTKKERWVLQEKIDLVKDREGHITKNGRVTTRNFYHDLNPYLINGKYQSCIGRFSPVLITNGIQGGAVQIVGTVK